VDDFDNQPAALPNSPIRIMASGSEQHASFLTRRAILRWGGFGILAGVAGYSAWPKAPKGRSTAGMIASSPTDESHPAPEPPAYLAGRDGFHSYLGSDFQIEAGPDSTTCRLVNVSETDSMTAPAGRFESFSLLFSAPVNFPAESRIYRLSHPQMESMELFLSPVGKPGESIYLEAVCSKRV
jgi:hypothetical protein